MPVFLPTLSGYPSCLRVRARIYQSVAGLTHKHRQPFPSMVHLEYPANLSPLTVFEQWEEATQTQREDANSTQIPELNRLDSGPSCCHPMPVLVPLYVFVLLTSIRMLPKENIIIQENARTLSSACSRFIVFGSWMSQEQKRPELLWPLSLASW